MFKVFSKQIGIATGLVAIAFGIAGCDQSHDTLEAPVASASATVSGTPSVTKTPLDIPVGSAPTSVHTPLSPPPVPPDPKRSESERAIGELDALVHQTSSPRDRMIVVMQKFCETWVGWDNALNASPGLHHIYPGRIPYYVDFRTRAAKYYDAAALEDWRYGTTSAGQLPPKFDQVWQERC